MTNQCSSDPFQAELDPGEDSVPTEAEEDDSIMNAALSAAETTSKPVDHTAAVEAVSQSLRFKGCSCTGRIVSSEEATLSLVEASKRHDDILMDIMAHVVRHNSLPDLSHLTPQQWERLLTFSDETKPLDLEKSSLKPGEYSIVRRYDLDAFIIPLNSLAAFRRTGFKFVYQASYSQHLQQSFHFRCGSAKVDPPECKQIFLGFSADVGIFKVYLCFKNIPVTRYKGEVLHNLNDAQKQILTDEFFLPSLRETYDEFVTAGHPSSFLDVDAKSKAAQKEAKRNESAMASQFVYTLPPEFEDDEGLLERFWTKVVTKMNAHSNKMWHKTQLVCVAYGTKADFASNDPLWLKLRKDRLLKEQLDERFVDRRSAYVDFGYQDLPRTPDGDPIDCILLRCACCNQMDLDLLGENQKKNEYSQNGLKQSTSVSVEFARKSEVFAAGLAYMQEYNCIKSIHATPDSRAERPFTQEWLNQLAYSVSDLMLLRERNQSAAALNTHSACQKERQRTSKVFKALVQRVHDCLFAAANDHVSACARQEYRVSLDLLDLLLDSLIGQTTNINVATGLHNPYFIIRKSDYIAFLRTEYNRFLMPLAHIVSRNRNKSVVTNYDPKKEAAHVDAAMISVLLTCLDITVNSGWIGRKHRVWKEAYEVPPKEATPDDELTRYGLDLGRIIKTYGMIHLRPDLFNWINVTFKIDQLAYSGFCNMDYRIFYRGTQSHDASDRFQCFVKFVIAQWTTQSTDFQITRMFDTLYEAIYHCYAKWILDYLGKPRQGKTKPKLPQIGSLTPSERRGDEGLSFDLVCRATGKKPPYITGTRVAVDGPAFEKGFNQFPNTFQWRLRLLFDFGDESRFQRKWDQLTFRQQTKYIYNELRAVCNVEIAEEWRSGIGTGPAASYITAMPHYNMNKIVRFHMIKNKRVREEELMWLCAQPIVRSGQPKDPSEVEWGLVTASTQNLLPSMQKSKLSLLKPRPFRLIVGLVVNQDGA